MQLLRYIFLWILRNCKQITHQPDFPKSPSAVSDHLDIKALPFMPLPSTPAIIFFAAEHLYDVKLTSNLFTISTRKSVCISFKF